MQSILRLKTASKRPTISRTIRLAPEHGLLNHETTLFGYSCGYGDDIHHLNRLDSDMSVREVKKRKPSAQSNLTPAAIAALRCAFDDYAIPAKQRRAEALRLERRISDLVNQAYGLTPEEVALMWKTAPPRMPIPPLLTKASEASALVSLAQPVKTQQIHIIALLAKLNSAE